MVKQLACVGALCLVLPGCATGPKYDEIKSAIPPLPASEGRVYFYRERNMVGAAVQSEIRVNGAPVGRSVPGGFFYIDRPPGNYAASVSSEAEHTLSLRVEAGQTLYVRSYVSIGLLIGRPYLELVPQTQWEGELPQLSYTGDSISAGAAASPAPQESNAPSESAAEKARMEDLRGLLPQTSR